MPRRAAAVLLLSMATIGLADMPQWYLDKGLSTVDTDGDGIPDVWEKRTYGNPVVADSHLDRDGDGLTDLDEFWLRTDPRTFSTMGDLWSDGEKVAAGLDPLARVEPTVGIEQWLAYLGWNAQMWSGWTAQAWLALHAPDEHGFGRPYSGFVYNTLPYSEPSRSGTVDFWLKTRTDRLALATVGDRLSTNTFLVLPGERRYRIRAAKDGLVSLAIDPLPGNFADIPGATNGLWICEMSIESAQSNLVVFPAGSPPSIPDPPEGLEALVVGKEPEEEPQAAPAPRLRSGAVRGGSEPAEPFLPLGLGPRKTDAVHERVSIGGDYGGIWCLSSPSSELPTFASLMVSAPGGVTVNGQPPAPDAPVSPPAEGGGAVTQSVASVKYPFMCRNVIIGFGLCTAQGGLYGAEAFGPHHAPGFYGQNHPCIWRGCENAGGPVTLIGFGHEKVNTRNLDIHPEEPDEDKLYHHCLGIVWKSEPLDLTNLLEYCGLDLAALNYDIRWEVNGKLRNSSELNLGGEAPEDLEPRVFRIKMLDVLPAGNLTVWDRLILVVNNGGTKTGYDSWVKHWSASSNRTWLAELPAAYKTLGTGNSDPEPNTMSWFGNWLSPKSPPAKFYHHTAVYEMRSQQTTGGHGNQACYTKDGKIIESGVGAGTADFVGPGWDKVGWGHGEHDVDPFVRALQLDGNPCKKIYKGAQLDHPMMYQGTNINSYLHCRPPSKGVLNPVITP